MSDFSSLFKLIKYELVDVAGIGELYVYGTVMRIGAKLGVFPEQVYLHAGTRIGVRNLGARCLRDCLEDDVAAARPAHTQGAGV